MTRHLLRGSGLYVGGRPRPLLPATGVEVASGQVTALVGEPGHSHTALALALAGRLRLDAGVVTLDGSTLEQPLQRAVALVDVPGVSEPDELVPFATILGEELAMAGQPATRSAVRSFAVGVEVRARTENVPVVSRTALLLRTAALRPGVRFVVLTLPDRWGVTPEEWEPLARELAGRDLGVVVTVGETSRHLLTVPWTRIGETA